MESGSRLLLLLLAGGTVEKMGDLGGPTHITAAAVAQAELGVQGVTSRQLQAHLKNFPTRHRTAPPTTDPHRSITARFTSLKPGN